MYDHVLVGTDGSVTATRAVGAAARLAHVHRAKLTIAHAFDPHSSQPDLEDAPDVRRWMTSPGVVAETLVDVAVAHAHQVSCGGLQIDGRAEPGDPVAVLVAVVQELQPGAVVVGNADLRRLRLRRSIGHSLSRRVPTDVVIVDTVGDGPGRRRTIRRVVPESGRASLVARTTCIATA